MVTPEILSQQFIAELCSKYSELNDKPALIQEIRNFMQDRFRDIMNLEKSRSNETLERFAGQIISDISKTNLRSEGAVIRSSIQSIISTQLDKSLNT